MARTFYRIVKKDPPTTDDFSPTPLRQGSIGNPYLQILASGISIWSTEALALSKARQFPRLGGYVAQLDIPDDSPIRIEKTLSPGHYTLWAAAAVLERFVVAISPIEG
ncbi:MAG: hypothetical protein ACYDAG_08475 [Chloroflexota bacterium]